MTTEFSPEVMAQIRADVAKWPRLTAERGAELRRIWAPAIARRRAAAEAATSSAVPAFGDLPIPGGTQGQRNPSTTRTA